MTEQSAVSLSKMLSQLSDPTVPVQQKQQIRDQLSAEASAAGPKNPWGAALGSTLYALAGTAAGYALGRPVGQLLGNMGGRWFEKVLERDGELTSLINEAKVRHGFDNLKVGTPEHAAAAKQIEEEVLRDVWGRLGPDLEGFSNRDSLWEKLKKGMELGGRSPPKEGSIAYRLLRAGTDYIADHAKNLAVVMPQGRSGVARAAGDMLGIIAGGGLGHATGAYGTVAGGDWFRDTSQDDRAKKALNLLMSNTLSSADAERLQQEYASHYMQRMKQRGSDLAGGIASFAVDFPLNFVSRMPWLRRKAAEHFPDEVLVKGTWRPTPIARDQLAEIVGDTLLSSPIAGTVGGFVTKATDNTDKYRDPFDMV